MENQENPIEDGHEHILTPSEVLEKIRTFSVNAEVLRDKSHIVGVYFIETKQERKGNYTIAYEYIRSRPLPTSPNSTAQTHISKMYFDGDIVTFAEVVANYDEETGIWEDVV